LARQNITAEVFRLAAPLAAELGLELVNVEFLKERGENILRVLIRKYSAAPCAAWKTAMCCLKPARRARSGYRPPR
jgi:hypothetical protein